MVDEIPSVRNSRSRRAFGLRCAGLVACALILGACTSLEDDRVRQLQHEKGFGTRADGIATAENYLAAGDQVQFILDPHAYLDPGRELLYLLANPQPVSIDGTIFVPLIGQIYALGAKESELGAIVTQYLSTVLSNPPLMHARILNTGKGFYMFGEVERAARFVPMTSGDVTLMDVVSKAPITDLANLGRVKVIKPDAQDPLVVVVNVREMIEGGNTTFNLRIDNHDIVYIPPTFLGHIARFFEKLLAPIGAVSRAALGYSYTRASIDYLLYDEANSAIFRAGRRF